MLHSLQGQTIKALIALESQTPFLNTMVWSGKLLYDARLAFTM